MVKTKSSSRKRSNPKQQKKSKGPNNIMIIALIVIIIGIIGVAAGIMMMNAPSDTGPNGNSDVNAVATINTSKGIIKIELFEDLIPKTCENFIKLADEGFYDGMIFHRVMDDFMIQAGNTYPDGSTVESPYGNIVFETHQDVFHVDGAISMASTGAGLGGSAQFFICDGAQSGLDGSYAAFGKTIEGISVVRDIADESHDSSYGSVGGGRPNSDIIIYSVLIED